MSRTVTFILIGIFAIMLVGAMVLATFFIGNRFLADAAQNDPVVTAVTLATPAITATPTITVTAEATTEGSTPVATSAATTAATVAATAAATSSHSTGCTDAATFIADVTVPDGSQVAPGSSFVKTWRLKNSGTCTWDGRYKLILAGGNTLGSLANSFPLEATVAPGELVDLSVTFVAPTNPETYESDWKLQNPQSQVFGIGANHNGPFWVKIVVPAAQTVISGLVYQDANQNGSYDSGELLMGSQQIWLIPGTACQVKQNAIAVSFSGADGRYTLAGEFNGSYCVGLPGNDGLNDVIGISVSSGQTLNNINLKAPVPSGSISGFVWSDYCLTNENGDALDGNCVADGNGDYHADGMIQPTETNIAGVTMLLQLGSCQNNTAVAVSAVTDASGKYVFNNLGPGTYCISMNAASSGNGPLLLPGDWTFPARGIWYQELTLLGNDNAYSVNFGWDYQLK